MRTQIENLPKRSIIFTKLRLKLIGWHELRQYRHTSQATGFVVQGLMYAASVIYPAGSCLWYIRHMERIFADVV